MPALPFSPSSLRTLVLMVAATAVCLLVAEGAFRLIGFDFEAGQKRAYAAYPPFYRQPRKPLGDVFFHRHGPATWTGNPLAAGLRADGGLDDAYADEAEVTITYDAEGFRNPDTLTAWTLAIGGDSFVELGHLPYADLFTTQLGRHLAVGVKNLGASYSGPLTYAAFLERFGAAPGTRHALMVFFEGNDLTDLDREAGWLRAFERTGTRTYRRLEKQPSLLKALYRLTARLARGEVRHTRFFSNAYLATPEGEQAVSVHYTPPASDAVPSVTKEALRQALAAWAAEARARGMRPWLVYMPCKRRVFHGHLRFTAETPQDLAAWQPTDLPALAGQLAAEHAMGFIDVTPALVRETRQGRLTYNPVWDTHLNRHGASIVARTLADTLRAYLKY